ncbi:MAG: FAD-binding oxidoreductase [Promethearchaeota archaeon]
MNEEEPRIKELNAELLQVISQDKIQKSAEILNEHSSDKFFSGIKPFLVIYPSNISEVSSILKICNKFSISVTPKSSGISFHKKSLLNSPGIIMNLTKMNKILEIDNENKSAIIEAGVDYSQLIDALKNEQLMPILPFAPHEKLLKYSPNL